MSTQLIASDHGDEEDKDAAATEASPHGLSSLSPTLQHELEERYRERLLSLCLSPQQLKQLAEIARREGVSRFTLVKRWIEARLEQFTAHRRAQLSEHRF